MNDTRIGYGDEEAASYKYKIQWIFPVAKDLFGGHIDYTKSLYSVVKALGAGSFDAINFKDSEGTIVTTHKNNILMPVKKANDKSIRFIKKQLLNPNIYYVELIRK